MTLKVLKKVKQIGKHKVDQEIGEDELNWPTEESPIFLDQDAGIMILKMKKDTEELGGKEGCDVDALIEIAKEIIIQRNNLEPCQKNRDVIQALNCALFHVNS